MANVNRHLAHWPAARSWTRSAIETRNPLLRPQTRAERVVTRLSAVGLVLFAVAAVLACLVSYDRGEAAEREQAATRHQLTGTVRSATHPQMVGSRFLTLSRVVVAYDVGGVQRTGELRRTPAPEVGSPQSIWVDADGRQTSPPHTRARTLRDTGLVALAGLGLLAVLVVTGGAAYDAWTIRRHAKDWEIAWSRFDADPDR
jgi:hypothetical protein